MVCVVCGMRCPFYSLWRSVPAIFIHGNMPKHHQEDKISLPAKMHLDRCQSRFSQPHWLAGPPLPPLSTAFLWYTAWWVLMLDGQCRGLVGQFGLSGGPLLHVLRRTRSSATSSAYSSCFLLILDLCSWEHKSSKTTMELGW